MEKLIQELQEAAEEAGKKLDKNTEWIERYAGYASEIKKNQDAIKKVRKLFREHKPLYVYSSISKAVNSKKEKRVVFDLRYRGQSVANIKHIKDKLMLDTEENTGKFYGIEGGESFEWKNEKAEIFRGGFLKYPDRKKGKKNNEEHRYESALLTELSKKKRIDKVQINIQPVLLAKSRFQMPTPFSASDIKGNVKYAAKGKGGGIDLLCRTKHGNKSVLSVFELKDEYEDPKNVLRQAIAYAVFVHKLLSTPKAESSIWWELFGFKKAPNTDRPLSINVVAALPLEKGRKPDKSFANKEVILSNGGIFRLHYFYFSLSGKDDKVDKVETSLFE